MRLLSIISLFSLILLSSCKKAARPEETQNSVFLLDGVEVDGDMGLGYFYSTDLKYQLTMKLGDDIQPNYEFHQGTHPNPSVISDDDVILTEETNPTNISYVVIDTIGLMYLTITESEKFPNYYSGSFHGKVNHEVYGTKTIAGSFHNLH